VFLSQGLSLGFAKIIYQTMMSIFYLKMGKGRSMKQNTKLTKQDLVVDGMDS
jgi:hypothetical protein